MSLNFFLIIMLGIILIDYRGVNSHKVKRIFFIYAYRASYNLNKDPLTGIYNQRLLDEFVIIVKLNDESIDCDKIIDLENQITERINSGLMKHNRLKLYEQEFSLSIGWEIASSQNFREALKTADEKMYEIKN